MFDGEHRIALHAMQRNQASSSSDVEVPYFFPSCSGNLECILELQWRWPFKTRVCSVTSGLLSSYEGHLRNLQEAWQGNREVSRGGERDQVSLSSCHRDVGIPINFQ